MPVYVEAEKNEVKEVCRHVFTLQGDPRDWCSIDDKGCIYLSKSLCPENQPRPDKLKEQEFDAGECPRICEDSTAFCSVLRATCIHKNYKHVGNGCPINVVWMVKDTRVYEYHRLCMEHGIVKACFEYEDGEAVDYIKISDKEFQLGRVGDCITNYTLP